MGKGSTTSTTSISLPLPPVKKKVQVKAEIKIPKHLQHSTSSTTSSANGPLAYSVLVTRVPSKESTKKKKLDTQDWITHLAESTARAKLERQSKQDDSNLEASKKAKLEKLERKVLTETQRGLQVTSVPPASSNTVDQNQDVRVPLTSRDNFLALPSNRADTDFIHTLIVTVAAAASRAAAKPVISGLSRAYNIPLTTLTAAADQELLELSSKDCMMDEEWICGNKALKGNKGWIRSKAGGWRKVCAQCKQHLECQQGVSDQNRWDSD